MTVQDDAKIMPFSLVLGWLMATGQRVPYSLVHLGRYSVDFFASTRLNLSVK
jgi:hypothetical protein